MGEAKGPPSPLRRLLEAGGYRLSEKPDGLLAVRHRDHRAVFVAGVARSPVDLEAEFPTDAIHKTIVYADEPGAAARAVASERGIELVGPSTLGSALGELLLPSSAGVAGSSSDSRSENTPLDPPPTIFPEGERTVLPRLARRDAESLAGVEGFHSTLRLVPFFVAPYRVRMSTPHGSRGPIADHLVAVNALSGRVDRWERGDRELAAELDEPHQRFEPAISEAQARSFAEAAIRRIHSVSVDHTEQHGGALVIETRRVPPAPEDVALGPMILVHVPYWYVESPEGRVVLDAVTGVRMPGENSEISPAP